MLLCTLGVTQSVRRWLLDARLTLGLSVKEVAYRLNVARQNVAAWEAGTKRPGFEHMVALADLYRDQLDVIACFANEVRPHPGARLDPGLKTRLVRCYNLLLQARQKMGENVEPQASDLMMAAIRSLREAIFSLNEH